MKPAWQSTSSTTIWRTIATVVLGAVLALCFSATPALAHAELLSTTPTDGSTLEASPSEVELTFNEQVQPVDGSFVLYISDAEVADLSAKSVDSHVEIALPNDLGNGSYAITYRVVSADGHPISGAVSFTVGDSPSSAAHSHAPDEEAPGGTEAAIVVLTIAQYVALLALAGLLFFRTVIARDDADEGEPTRLVRVMATVAVGASALLIPFVALRIVGGNPWQIVDPALWSSGVYWQPVAGTLVVLPAAIGSWAGRRSARIMAPLALLALVAPLLTGHSQSESPRWLMTAADIGHLAAGAFWLGGVIALARYLRQGHADEPRLAASLRVVTRFSGAAIWSVAILALSGTIMAVLILGSWQALGATGYGRTLLIKLCVVLAVIALAWWNRSRLVPRVRRPSETAAQWAALRRLVRYEAGLLLAVIVVTGVLTNSSPTAHTHTASAQAHESSVNVESQGLAVSGTMSPSLPGANQVTFTLEYDGEPVTPQDVTVRALEPGRLVEVDGIVTFDEAAGSYSATLQLHVSGTWQIEFSARVSTYEAPIAIAEVQIG